MVLMSRMNIPHILTEATDGAGNLEAAVSRNDDRKGATALHLYACFPVG